MPQQGKAGERSALSLRYCDISLVGQCRENHIIAICIAPVPKVRGWPSAAPANDHVGL